MKVAKWKIFLWLGLFGYAFFAFIHGNSYAGDKHSTLYNVTGGIALAIVALTAFIGRVGQGRRR
jgi:hypothetical protein